MTTAITTDFERELPAGVCYRHPDRQAAIRCHRCSRTICPQCMVGAPVGFQCPDCVSEGLKRTRQFVLAATPVLTYLLIAANVLVAVACLASSDEWASGRTGPIAIDWGLLGGGVLFDGGTLRLIGVDHGEWYRVVTAAFIHGGPIHLLFNMFALWQAGTILEGALGRARFAGLFFASVLGGSFGALVLAPDTLAVGASGGVFGLMGALFIGQRKGLPALQGASVGLFIVINLVLTAAIPGISMGGHVGGLLAGLAVGWGMFEFERRQLPPGLPLAVTGLLCSVLFLGCLLAATRWSDPLF